MNWFDIPMILLILGITYVGTRRGFLGGIFDILALATGSLVASALSGRIAHIVHQGTGIDYRIVSTLLWLIFFGTISAGIIYVGSLLNEPAQNGTPLFLWQGVGGMVGFVEGFILLFVIFFLVGQVEMHNNVTRTLKESAVVTNVQKINPVAEQVFTGVTNPRSHQGISRSFRKSVFADKKI